MTLLESGRTIGDRYRLVRLLAKGSMGAVWVARHLQLDVDVAIKFMSPACAASSGARVRFEHEAKAAAQLKSPHVVQVYDYGIDGDAPYIVMELLEGEDLAAQLHREGRITLPATLGIVSQVCKALRRAHAHDLVHRDLKPANIFLCRQSGEEIAKILDFGVAKAMRRGLSGVETKTGALIGTPQYMSPEQVRQSKAIDHRSDLWSLGVIVFRCVTGRLPFASKALGAVLVEICADPIPVPSQLAPDLGPDVDQFLARALMRAPDQRFQSADELAEAFAAVVRSSMARVEGTGLGPASRPALTGRAPLPRAARCVPPPPSPDAATTLISTTAFLADTLPADAAALGPPASPRSNSTLAPSGCSLLPPNLGSRSKRIVLATACGTASLVIATVSLLRAQTPQDGLATSLEPAAAPPTAWSASAAPATAPSGGLPSWMETPVSDAAPSAVALPPAPSATAPVSPKLRPPAKGTPRPPTPGKTDAPRGPM
jgi:serine/threonine-protein kinase